MRVRKSFEQLKVGVADIASTVKFVATEFVSTIGLLVLGWGPLWDIQHLFGK